MDEEVRGEAARLARRVRVARDRLADLPGGDDDTARPGSDLHTLLGPSAARISALLEVAEALADGRLTDPAARDAAAGVAGAQPARRPR